MMAETPPPLPPKKKRPHGGAFVIAPANDGRRKESALYPSSRSLSEPDGVGTNSKKSFVEGGFLQVTVGKPECGSDANAGRVITWGANRLQEHRDHSDDLYENVSNAGVNYLEQRLKSIVSEGKRMTKGGKRKAPKIEVRQEENKTVVKISIKDASSPEDDLTGENRVEGLYANDFVCVGEKEGSARICGEEEMYENVVVGEKALCEEPFDNCYENVQEHLYENGSFGSGAKKEWRAEAKYCNPGEKNGGCGEVYESVGFDIFESCVLDQRDRYSVPPGENLSDHENDDSYENVKADYRIYANEDLCRNAERPNETAEKDESGKSHHKSSVVEVFLQKPTMVKVEKMIAECTDDNSTGDPFDSGTCSDVDSLPTFAQGKKVNVIVTIKSLGEEKLDEKKMESGHGRAESLTSSGVGVDSEESDDDKSNISCDSLNSNDPYAQSYGEDHGYHTPNSDEKTGSPVDRIEYENAIDKTNVIRQMADASRKIKNLRMENAGKVVRSFEIEECDNPSGPLKTCKKKAPPSPPFAKIVLDALPKSAEGANIKTLPKSLLRDIRSRIVRLSAAYPSGEKQEVRGSAIASAVLSLEAKTRPATQANHGKHLVVEEKTYDERKSEGGVKVSKICAMEVDTDKFYKFHLTENIRDKGGEGGGDDHEETFAGVKNFLCSEKPAAITSAKGTIRGVKNRVKAGIATFLQLHENKSYKDRDAGKVVVYTTTMGIVRNTYQKCLKVKQILKTLMVKFEERDVFMSAEAQEEIRNRMKCDTILVPQVFVEGQHIGDAEAIDRLNETGELRTILKPYKSADVCSTCKICGGYRLLPCSICKGSKKSIHRNHFTAEFVALKCMNCDQVGLTKCHAC